MFCGLNLDIFSHYLQPDLSNLLSKQVCHFVTFFLTTHLTEKYINKSNTMKDESVKKKQSRSLLKTK